MPIIADPLVIFARSGRALAQSAKRAHLSTVVVDAFADQDTRRAAHCKPVAWSDDGPQNVQNALRDCKQAVGLVYGSGLEAMPELLETWSGTQKLYGNRPSVLRKVNTPHCFFPLLEALDIPHPELQFDPPSACGGWLLKRAGSAGGCHVRPWTGREAYTARDYFQKRIPGPALSVLFLANGERAYIIGYNTQWTMPECFVWSGAINRTLLDSPQRLVLVRYVGLLVTALRLRGLNSLDFVMDDRVPKVLELNARPGASFELYDADFKHGLLHWHLQACRGRLPGPLDSRHVKVRASRIFFARQRLSAPVDFVWPVWSRDIPAAGTVFQPGEPVCTATAQGQDWRRVTSCLIGRMAKMGRQLIAYERRVWA